MSFPLRAIKCACLATFFAFVLHPGTASAARPFDTWGKADVSFEDYRADAVSCGRIAHYADVSETEQAKTFVRASRLLEAAEGNGMGPGGASAADDMYRLAEIAARSERIRSSIRPEKLMRELHAGLQAIVENCLQERGYSRFRLTADQYKALRKLKEGSPERHRFLHSLASDSRVLASQKLDHG